MYTLKMGVQFISLCSNQFPRKLYLEVSGWLQRHVRCKVKISETCGEKTWVQSFTQRRTLNNDLAQNILIISETWTLNYMQNYFMVMICFFKKIFCI